MGVFLANGTRVTKATLPTTTSGVDPLVKLTSTIYLTKRVSELDTPDGSSKRVLYRAGTVIRQSMLDRLFLPATVTSLSVTTGPAAGGTVVTIKGTNLTGVSGVTFGGTAGTALTVVSDTEVRVTTPAKSAGAHAVVVADDSGNTAAGNFTYS